MSEPTRASRRAPCATCHKETAGLRRGLCRACYLRAWRGTELPPRATCTLCSERRRIVLRWTRVGMERIVTCQNCGFVADRARPRPRSLDELKALLRRERRRGDRRRNYIIEPEDPAERRQAGRRRGRRLQLS